jgi:hypothetical protein
MPNKGLLATVAAAALATIGAISQAHASVEQLLPGTPLVVADVLDPFQFTFDENGNAFVRIFANGQYGAPEVIKPIAGAPFLTWNLPQPVIPGDVSFAEPGHDLCTGASDCSDGLRFITVGGKSTMLFFSNAEADGNNSLADTGFPEGFNFTRFQQREIGSELVNGFVYNAGPGDPNLTNVYRGISDAPEASTWAMMIIGFAGLGYAAFRRGRVSASLA